MSEQPTYEQLTAQNERLRDVALRAASFLRDIGWAGEMCEALRGVAAESPVQSQERHDAAVRAGVWREAEALLLQESRKLKRHDEQDERTGWEKASDLCGNCAAEAARGGEVQS